MTTTDQRWAWVLTKVLCDELTVHEAAAILGLSERSVWRLRPRFAAEGPAASSTATAAGHPGGGSRRRSGTTSSPWPAAEAASGQPSRSDRGLFVTDASRQRW